MTVELAEFGIKVCCIEPGYFRSNFLNSGNRLIAKAHIPDYDGTASRETQAAMEAYNNKQPGDIVKGARTIVDVLSQTGVAEGREIPMRLGIGSDCFNVITGKCNDTITLMEQWNDITISTDHDDVKH